MSAEILKALGALLAGLFLLDLVARLCFGAWFHEATAHRRTHRRYAAALANIAAARLTPDEHTAQATEAQWLRALARNALNPDREAGPDPELALLDARVGAAIRLHQAALVPEPGTPGAEQRPPAGAT